MKTISLVVVSAVFLLGLFACSNETGNNGQSVGNTSEQNNMKDVRENVWGQLSSQQKEQIEDSWQDAKVSKITLTKTMMTLVEDKSYEGKEVYLIDFPTKEKSRLPNNLIVYADLDTFDYIGDGLVD
ncbi:hypothetical protein [Bacillus niameyensis]|uniref:hypothetical protein n=1 Tax=Bacillus niameyensis TaxID=1522308 RepID=UPI000780CC86|nr:hypothetical protein [Bacillus niameyensis]